MTREEAIECLNFQNEKFFGGQSEALKMGISALKELVPFDFELFQAGLMDVPEGVTNGEVIQALFPEVKVEIDGFLVRCIFIEHEFTTTEEWWNAPYQKDGE